MAAQAWPWQMPYRKSGDVEVGTAPPPLYPTMLENPSMRWSFIRKVYSIVAFQLLLTVAVATVVVVVHPISSFFVTSPGGLAVYIVLLIVPLLTLCPLYFYHQRHPINFFLLGIFTISLSFLVGLSCAFTNGKVVFEAVILTTVVVVTLTLYTFWAARRGHDFSFLAPFLLGSLTVLIVFGLIQAFFPLGRITTIVYGGLAALVFCGYIIYDTDNLIKRYSYDEYIWASVSLYLDIINLFLSLLTLLRAAES